jgi:phosphotriesterase-related protein
MKKLSLILISITLFSCGGQNELSLITVNGEVKGYDSGFILEHEHVLVDFSGAEGYDPARWNHDSVQLKVLPFLKEVESLGGGTLIDATPQFLGRDVALLKRLSDESGLNIITNTGLYGAVERKYLPEYVYNSSPQDLADRWIVEFEKGIDGTGIKPGFIKISVNPGELGDVESKLVEAACITHKATGLTIASHTGPAVAAFEELEILKIHGIAPSAFIWIHAQNEEDWNKCLEAANRGAWIAFDGLNDDNVSEYIERINFMKENGVLNKLLISHDAGWYDPDKPGGGDFRPYNTVFENLLPSLKGQDYSESEIEQIFKKNPVEAFAIRVRLEN